MKPIVVRGGGDLATGVIHRLSKSGYSVIVLETDKPSAIRRLVAFSEAVEKGSACVEGITCVCVNSVKEALKEAKPLHPVLLVDPKGESIPLLKPEILIDAIIAKKNLGTTRKLAPLTIALGPGFEAGKDVDYVVETNHLPHLISLIVNDDFFQGLPEDERNIMTEAAALATVYAREQSDARIADRVATIEESGTKIITLSDETRNEIRQAAQGVYKTIQDTIDPAIYDSYTAN